MAKLGNYLRARRRQCHLTQGELAFLFGYENGSIVSRFEREERSIPVAVWFASELIFGSEPRELFPAFSESVEEGVVTRMHELRGRLLQVKPTQRTRAKLEVLQQALARAMEGDPMEV